jgi:lipid-binding SYLF domain-containing protein
MVKVMSFCFISVFFLSGISYSQSSEQKRVQNSIGIMATTTEIPDSILKNAQAIAVLPGVAKASVGVSGLYGTGTMSVKKSDGCWSDPVFVTLSGSKVGKQAGGGISDVILVIMNKSVVTDLESGDVTLGQTVTVASGPVKKGTSAKAADIYSYVKTNGTLNNTSLNGYTLKIDSGSNKSYYGDNTTAQQIIKGNVKNAPSSASDFSREVGNLTGVCKK